jgi:hypothetical protein
VKLNLPKDMSIFLRIMFVLMFSLAVAPASDAWAADDKKDEKKKTEKAAPAAPIAPIAPSKPKGDVVMESISQPIVRGRKIVSYEHATIILWLRTRDHAAIVCSNRYRLADAILIDLHDNPISSRRKKDGHAEAEERLYELALGIFGPRVIKRLRIEWHRSPTGGKTTIFGTFTDVQCDTSS